MVGIRGHAQAEGERDGLVVEHVGEPAPQPLGDDEGLVLIGLGEHERELLAADPGRHVDAALVVLEQSTDRLERLVAGVMTEQVVEVLEEVAVAHQQAEGAPAALRARQLGVDHRLEAAPVQQPGEGVGARGIRELVDQPPDALAQGHEEDTRDGERAGHEDEGRDVLVRVEAARGMAEDPRADDHQRVVDDREQAEDGGLRARQEVERVQRDPQVEEQVGARAPTGEGDRQRGHRGGAERAARGHPAGRPLVEDHQCRGGEQGGALDHEQAERVESSRVREQDAERADDAGGGEERGLRPRRHARGQRPDGESGLLPGRPVNAHVPSYRSADDVP